jgi:hypothetical protein
MGVLLQDRLSAILFYIEQWKDTDPKLEYKEGFLNYLTTCDIGQFKEGNSNIWMNYFNEAQKKGITIAELLFLKQKRFLALESRTKKHVDK